MLNKGKHKKGSSLIEIIISMALLSILMIPLSSAIIQLVNTNKNGEVKQIASYEGQKILEEFKGYSEIKLYDGKFKLLNGEELKRVGTDKYESKFNVTNDNIPYEVKVSVVKNEKFDNNIKDEKESINVNFDKNNKVNIDKKQVDFRSNYMKIKISNVSSNLSSYKIEFYSGQLNDNTGTELSLIDTLTKEDIYSKNIIINMGREYTSDLNIEIENNIKNSNKELNFEVNVFKPENEDKRKINATSTSGNNIVRVNRNLEVGASGTLEQLYIINVNVTKQGDQDKLLFESSNTQNIIIS